MVKVGCGGGGGACGKTGAGGNGSLGETVGFVADVRIGECGSDIGIGTAGG